MKELIVETTGRFMLLDRFSGREIPSEGSATVPETPFIRERLENGDLRLIEGELSPEIETPETELEHEEDDETLSETETDTDQEDGEGEGSSTETITEGAVEAPTKTSPLDHDGDGKPGGSPKGEESTAHKGAAKRRGK